MKMNVKTFPHKEKGYAYSLQKKCLYNNEMKTLFPRSSRKSKMATRHQEKYKVKFARTERLRKSAIPYMQKLLNNCN